MDRQNISSLRNSLQTLVGFFYSRPIIAHKDQLESHAKFVDATLDPYPHVTLSSIHNLWWEIHLVCETHVALNYTPLLESVRSHCSTTLEISFDMSRMCARMCRLRYYTNGSPQNVIVVESRKCWLPTTKNTPFRLKSPWKRVQVLTIDKTPICVVSTLDTLALALSRDT